MIIGIPVGAFFLIIVLTTALIYMKRKKMHCFSERSRAVIRKGGSYIYPTVPINREVKLNKPENDTKFKPQVLSYQGFLSAINIPYLQF